MLSEKPWRGEAVIQFCAAQFACLCFGIAAAGLLQKFGAAGFKQPDDFGNVLLATLSFQGVTWILIPIFLRRHRTGWREIFGLRGPRLGRSLLMAALVLIVILPVAVLIQIASVMVLKKLGFPPEEQAAVLMLAAAKTWWMRIYFGVFAIVIAPVAEEFIFRGMLFPFLKRLGFPNLAWFGVSFLFAAIHFDAAIFLPLFTLALALTWLYEKTDDLLAPVAVHALFNAVNFVVLISQTKLGQG